MHRLRRDGRSPAGECGHWRPALRAGGIPRTYAPLGVLTRHSVVPNSHSANAEWSGGQKRGPRAAASGGRFQDPRRAAASLMLDEACRSRAGGALGHVPASTSTTGVHAPAGRRARPISLSMERRQRTCVRSSSRIWVCFRRTRGSRKDLPRCHGNRWRSAATKPWVPHWKPGPGQPRAGAASGHRAG